MNFITGNTREVKSLGVADNKVVGKPPPRNKDSSVRIRPRRQAESVIVAFAHRVVSAHYPVGAVGRKPEAIDETQIFNAAGVVSSGQIRAVWSAQFHVGVEAATAGSNDDQVHQFVSGSLKPRSEERRVGKETASENLAGIDRHGGGGRKLRQAESVIVAFAQRDGIRHSLVSGVHPYAHAIYETQIFNAAGVVSSGQIRAVWSAQFHVGVEAATAGSYDDQVHQFVSGSLKP